MNKYLSWWQIMILLLAGMWLLLWLVPVLADFLTQGGVRQRRLHFAIQNYLLALRERAQDVIPRMRSRLHCASLQVDGYDDFWRKLQEASEIDGDPVLISLLSEKVGEAVKETTAKLSFEKRKRFIDGVADLIHVASREEQ